MQLKTNETPLGLCQDCVFRQQIASPKGSVFQRCNMSLQDPRYPKYPRLPVLICAAYTPKAFRPDAVQ